MQGLLFVFVPSFKEKLRKEDNNKLIPKNKLSQGDGENQKRSK